MSVKEANITCLLNCAENILQCKIKCLATFKNMSLFYKILNEPIVETNIDSLICKLSDIYMTNMENLLDIKNKDILSDLELSKILLLCIVVYILMSNSPDKSSNKLVNLCDNIPDYLHHNACIMFAPLIVKYSDKAEITKEDLDNALLVNDKENETTFYSPIREKHRSHMITDKHITTHKKNVHQEMKACKSFDIFPLEGCSASVPLISKTSPLVKLVQYVQSPKFQGKSLIKTNRDLEKSVKQLEDQLFWNENELDKKVNDWKRKCNNLESEIKDMRSILNGKDAVIFEKSQEIGQLRHFAEQNKRLDEKLKDYYVKLEEIRVLNSQFEQKCEENRVLKIENRESRHFKALAIDRRIKIENLSVDLNSYKHMVSELTETQARLSETESQLTELQNHMHSLQRNANNDSLSEISLNSSLVNPECLFGIVEMERDSLRNELDSAKDHISSLTKDLNETNLRMEQMSLDQQSFNKLVEIIKEDISQVGLVSDLNLCTNSVFNHLKEVFCKIDNVIFQQKENVSQLNASIDSLTNQLNNVMKINNDLEDVVASNKENVIQLNKEFELKIKENTENVTNLVTAEFNEKINDLVTKYDRKELLMKNDLSRLIEDYEECLSKLEHATRTYEDQINVSNAQLEDSKGTVDVLETEIKSLKHQLEFSDYKMDDLLKELQEQNKETFVQGLKLKEINDKLTLKEREICDVEKTQKETQELYQECLMNLTRVTCEFEEAIKMKNDEIHDQKTEINKLQNEIVTADDKRKDLLKHLDETNKEISLENHNISEELLKKEEVLSKLQEIIEEEKDKHRLSLFELDKLQSIQKEYEFLKAEFDEVCRESLDSSGEMEKLKAELLSKNTFITQIMENHLQEMEKFASDYKEKDDKIFEYQQELDCRRQELVSNEVKMLEMQREQLNMNETFQRNRQELDNLKNINSELELTCNNFKEVSSQAVKEAQCELRSARADLEKCEGQLSSLMKDLIVKDDELKSCLENITQLQLGIENEKSDKITELARIQDELDKNAIIFAEKDEGLRKTNNMISQLEISLEKSNEKLNDFRIQCEYLTVIDEKYVHLTKDHLELERRFDKSNNEYSEINRLKTEEITNLKAALENLKIKEDSLVTDNEEREVKIRQLTQELASAKILVDSLENKSIQVTEEYGIEIDKFLNEKIQALQEVNERDLIIDGLQCQISQLEGQEKQMKHSLGVYSDKIATLEKTVSDQDKTISSMEQSIKSNTKEISRLNELLKNAAHENDSKDKEIRFGKEQIAQMELKRIELNNAISRLNGLVSDYEKEKLIKETQISDIQRMSNAEIQSLQAVNSEQNQKLEALNNRIQDLIAEKEMKISELSNAHLNEDNCSLKRSVAELGAKLNSLKIILREHTEKEMRQMSGKYHGNTRYARLSQWASRPQLSRQLPPVDQLDKETVLAIGLDPASKTKFESFVFSPYTCEDESSIIFHKQFPQANPKRLEVTRKTEVNDTMPQINTPLKKKKAGIRQQITAKIRKSLHLESTQDSKSNDRSITDLVSQGSGTKNPLSLLSKSSGKPPVMPRKKIAEKLKSSQVTIIDLDEYRQRNEKKESSAIKRKYKKNQESIQSISSTTQLNMVDSTSICSLFDCSDDIRSAVMSTESSSYQNQNNEVRSLDSPFSQRPKTPKPNSIIKRLIRKSKIMTPKKKLSSIDKLLK